MIPGFVRARTVVFGGVLLGSLISGCGAGAAATVGETAITRESLARELGAIASNLAYVKNYEKGSNNKAFDSKHRPTKAFTAVTLTNRITSVAVRELVAEKKVSIGADDRRRGSFAARRAVGGEELFKRFPAWYQRDLDARFARSRALLRFFMDQSTSQEFHRRYGSNFSRACTRDLVVKTKAEAEQARRRISSGEPFAAVARELSLDRGSGPKGGLLGCFPRGDLVPELDNIAFLHPVGTLSQPLFTETGWHILLVERRYVPPLGEIRGEIDIARGEAAGGELKSLIRLRLREAGVRVARDIGRWNAEHVVVLAG